MKPVEFLGSSLDDLRSFPPEARRAMGYQIDRVQHGLDPDDWKSMHDLGAGVREIRVREEGNAYRSIYVAKMPEAIYILHCFQKKSQATRKTDLDVTRRRLAELMARRNRSTP